MPEAANASPDGCIVEQVTERSSSGVPIDDLLSHAPWLRGVARSLVREPGAAEDVVQETWLTALRSPPGRAENLRGWLSRTLHNLVRQRARSDRSRSEREQAQPSAAAGPPLSPAALVQGAEMQRLLAEEVMDLREPFRTTILRRYYEGLEPVRIAGLEGIPAGTVRWRLKRGLELLRAQMDDRVDRSTWQLGLLALVGADLWGSGSSWLSQWLLRSPLTSVSKGSWIALGTLTAAAALAGAAVLRELGPADAAPPSEAISTLDAALVRAGGEGGGRRPVESSGAHDGARSDHGVVATAVRGVVLRLDSDVPGGFEPAVGVSVAGEVHWACADGGDATGAPLQAPLATVTGDGGRFELSVPALAGAQPTAATLHLRALGDALHTGEEAIVPLAAASGTDGLELLLVPHGALLGRTREAGAPVAGVELVFEGGSLRSNERGRFWMRDYAGQRLLGVRDDRYAEAEVALRDGGTWTAASVVLARASSSAGPPDPSVHGVRLSPFSGRLSSSRRGAVARSATTFMRMHQGPRVGRSALLPTPGPGVSLDGAAAAPDRELSSAVGRLQRAGVHAFSAMSARAARAGSRRGGASPGAALGCTAGGTDFAVAALLRAEALIHGPPGARRASCAAGLHAVDEDPARFFALPAAGAPACRAWVEALGQRLALTLPPDEFDRRPDRPAASANAGAATPSAAPRRQPTRSGHADSPQASPQTGAGIVVEPAGASATS